MVEHRKQAAGAAFAGRVCISGGYSSCEEWRKCALHTVEWYDPQIQAWTAAPPLMISRLGHGAVNAAGNLHVCGGMNEQSHPHALCSAEVLQSKTGSWALLPAMSVKRTNFSIHTIGRRIYVVGGESHAFCDRKLNDCERFDPQQKSWEAWLSMPATRGSHSGAVLSKCSMLGL